MLCLLAEEKMMYTVATGKVAADKALQPRIDKMLRRDERMGGALVVFVWLAVAFVFFAIHAWVSDPAIRWVLLAAGGVLLLFNTASMVAMIRHYHEDKQFIYELDIRHLDANRQVKAVPAAEQRETVR